MTLPSIDIKFEKELRVGTLSRIVSSAKIHVLATADDDDDDDESSLCCCL
jgi:hypothetical protein